MAKGRERILVDAGPIVALFRLDDEHHKACERQFGKLRPPLWTCWPVITEAAWLLRKRPDAVERCFAAFARGLLRLMILDEPAVPWVAAFVKRYRSLGAQVADAALVYLAEREQIRTVFTLDRRDFSVYRLSHNRRLRLLPP